MPVSKPAHSFQPERGKHTGTVNGVLVAGAATRSRIPFDSLVVLMRNGNAYVNLHTTAFPGGEIRGQITN